MIFLGGTSGFHYGQVVLQIHLSVGQVDFLTKFDPCILLQNISTIEPLFYDHSQNQIGVFVKEGWSSTRGLTIL